MHIFKILLNWKLKRHSEKMLLETHYKKPESSKCCHKKKSTFLWRKQVLFGHPLCNGVIVHRSLSQNNIHCLNLFRCQDGVTGNNCDQSPTVTVGGWGSYKREDPMKAKGYLPEATKRLEEILAKIRANEIQAKVDAEEEQNWFPFQRQWRIYYLRI